MLPVGAIRHGDTDRVSTVVQVLVGGREGALAVGEVDNGGVAAAIIALYLSD
jgi:hypothetical protein